jgi:translocator protein
MPKRSFSLLVLIICLAIPLLVGAIAGYATATNVTGWYVSLKKPEFNPPNQVFGPVWTVLYLLMGFTLYKIVVSKTRSNRKALLLFSIQLVLNFLWSFLFFYYHLVGLALVDILLLLVFIILLIRETRQLNTVAAYLQLPYLFWVAFASCLNASIWYLNK